MFTKEELINLFIILNDKATFTLTGQEADLFVSIKLRVKQELEKLNKPAEKPEE